MRRSSLHTFVPFVQFLEWVQPGHLETHTESKSFLLGHLRQLGGPPHYLHGGPAAAVLSWRHFLARLSCGLSRCNVCSLRASPAAGVRGPLEQVPLGHLSRREGQPFGPWCTSMGWAFWLLDRWALTQLVFRGTVCSRPSPACLPFSTGTALVFSYPPTCLPLPLTLEHARSSLTPPFVPFREVQKELQAGSREGKLLVGNVL